MSMRLIYFADPMCSWCYGFAPEITRLTSETNKKLEFQLVMGGLRPGGKERISDMDDFLKHHWDQVHQRSGQPFRYEILSNEDFIYDTEPACRAVVTIRTLDPQSEFDYFKKVQTAFYYENKDTNDPQTFADLAPGNIEPEIFLEAFHSESMVSKTRGDFIFSQQAGVRGFPTTVLQIDKALYLLAHGYMEAGEILKRISDLLADSERNRS